MPSPPTRLLRNCDLEPTPHSIHQDMRIAGLRPEGLHRQFQRTVMVPDTGSYPHLAARKDEGI